MRRLVKIQRLCAKCSNFFLVFLLLGHQILRFPTISASSAHSRNSQPTGDGMSLKSAELTTEQLEDFRRSFLAKMGLQSRMKRQIEPEKSAEKPPLEVPEYLWDIYDRILEENSAEFDSGEDTELFWGSGANTIRNVFADSQEIYSLDGGDGVSLKFNLTDLPTTETFTEAELRLQIVKHRDRHVRISISELADSCKGIVNLLDTKIVPNDSGLEENSIVFDVLPAIFRTFSRENRIATFVVDVRDAQNRPVKNISEWIVFPWTGGTEIPSEHSDSEISQPAALLLYSTDSAGPKSGARRRAKRGAKNRGGKKRRGGRRRHGAKKNKIKPRHNMCKKRGLYVDFRELNWQDWILAPTGYEAFFCAGTCEYPIVNTQNTTNHAIVQSLVHSVSPGTVPPPCCVPTEMSAISMLYIDIDNRIVIKNYPEMIVEGCGCR